MKAVIKAIVPSSIWDSARRGRDRLAFAITKRLRFDPVNLRSMSDADLSRIWRRDDIAESWAEDNAGLAQVFGGEHIFAGANPGDRRAIYYLVLALRPASVLEVGTFVGASLIHIVSALKRTGGHVDAVDIADVNDKEGPWSGAGLAGPPGYLISALGGSEQAKFHVSPSVEFMRSTERTYDFIFLDGDYSAQAQYREINAALSILNEGGIILLHNYYPNSSPLFPDGIVIKGPFDAMRRIQREEPNIRAHPIGTLPWPTKQGTNKTTLALLLRK